MSKQSKTPKELEDWLHRLEQPRAGSIFDNHCELGMMYVLRKLLGKDTKDLEKQALKWRDRVFKANYDRIDLANFKKGLVDALQKKIKNIEEEQNIWYDPEDQIRLEAYREFLARLDVKEQKKEVKKGEKMGY